MSIDRIFIAFAVLLGLAVGAVLVLVTESRDFRLPPYFWVLIALGLFEAIAYSRRRGAGVAIITVQTRIVGFVIALALMWLIPMWAGVPIKLF